MSTKLLKFAVTATVFGFATQASALDLGYDATIWDGAGVLYEDGETEPGMENTQNWDMEGFFFDYSSNTLSMVGGFDVINGYGGYQAGDIFLSTGTPLYGDIDGDPGYQTVDNKYGYDYVLDMDYANGTWELLELDPNSQVLTADIEYNEGSSPFQYVSGGNSTGINGSFGLTTATDAETGFSGGTHYVLSVDLSELIQDTSNNTTFYSHFTMGCGNDNLMGSWAVPEPATIALLGMGLFGLLFARRKQQNSNSLSA